MLRRSPWSFEPQVEVRAAGRNYRLDFGLRENNLRAEGWDFVRFGWVDFDDEAEIHRRVAVTARQCRIVA